MPGPQRPLPGKVTSELRQENGGPALEGFLKEGALSSEPSGEGRSRLMQEHERPRGGSEEQVCRGADSGLKIGSHLHVKRQPSQDRVSAESPGRPPAAQGGGCRWGGRAPAGRTVRRLASEPRPGAPGAAPVSHGRETVPGQGWECVWSGRGRGSVGQLR